MHLTPLREADRTYLARLNFLADTYGDEHAALSEGFASDYAFYVTRWRPEHGGFAAWEGLIPAGGAWLNWAKEDCRGHGFISGDIPELSIAVEPRFRGRGVGTTLIEAVCALATTMGAPGVSLSVAPANERAYRVYRRCGFVTVRSCGGYEVMLRREDTSPQAARPSAPSSPPRIG